VEEGVNDVVVDSATGLDEQPTRITIEMAIATPPHRLASFCIDSPGYRSTGRYRRAVGLATSGAQGIVAGGRKEGSKKPKVGLGEGEIVTPPEGASWQSLVRARMREEIDEWVAEGLSEAQPDGPLVLIDVMGVVSDSSPPTVTESGKAADRVGDDGDALEIPSYMPALVRHLVEVADVWWSTPVDEELYARLTDCLGVDPLPCVAADEYGMTEPAARELLWKAASARRGTYRIENVTSEIPSRLPDSTVLINIAPDKVLRPDHLPPELRPV
jgi:hypothetical protein